jgi:hypothetical protein
MNEKELRKRVSKRRKISEEGWALMREGDYVGDALEQDFDEEKIEYIIEKYDKHKAAFGKTRVRRQTPDQERSEVPVSLREWELERKAAFEEYAAKHAACDDGVRWFRDRVLGGRLLTAEQARDLILSPAARFLEVNKFECGGGDVPLVAHRATLKGYEPKSGNDREVRHRATVAVDPPGMTETVENTFYDPLRPVPKRPRFKDGTDGQALYYVNERGRARKVSVWEQSLLESLRGLSERLAQWYRWEPAQATMFVLTGEIPAVPALKVGTSVKHVAELYPAKTATPEYIDATITIVASPWVSEERVKNHYRKAKIEVMGTSGGKPSSRKNLKLFRFVTERVDPTITRGHTKMPNGKTLVSEWNEAYPDWAYMTSVGDLDTRRFWRDYNRIKRTIAVGPPYQSRNPAAAARQPRQTDGS